MIAASLQMILRGVLAVLGNWRLEYRLMPLVHRRFTATFQGIERLLMRYRAGRLRRVEMAVPRQRKPRGKIAVVVMPRRFGWLVQAGGYQAVGYGAQLQTVLSTPEMVALLAASPQAVRLLRPLCRALALELAWVRDAPRVVADGEATKPRKRKPRVKPEPFRIALPRGVLTAARRQGFGKMC
jgi:hypothetical protein